MLMGGDFTLNSLQRYNDTLVEVLKHTILEHEAIFRWQVHELHRLYKIQKTVMEDIGWRGFKGCTSWASSAQSTLLPLQDRPNYKQLNDEEFLPASSMVDLRQTSYQDCFQKAPGTCPKVKPRPLDLQLPVDDYISHFGAELPKQPRQGDSWVSPKVALKVGNFLVGNQIAVAEEVKLSLGAGKDTRNQGSQGRCTSLSVQDVIDLEGSAGRTLLHVAEPCSSIDVKEPSAYIGDKSQFEVSTTCDLSFSAKAREKPVHWSFINCPLKDDERRGKKSFCPGVDHFRGNCPSVDQYNRKPSGLCKMEFVDLNRVQLEESSWFSDAPLATLPSPAASSSVVSQRLTDVGHAVSTCWRKPNSSSYSGDTSDLPQPDNAACSTLTDAGEKDNRAQASSRSIGLKANSRNKMGLIDLESLPEDSPELSGNIVGQNTEARGTNIDSSLGGQCSFLHHHHHKMDDSIVSPSSKLVDGNLCTSVVGCPHSSQTAKDVEIGQESCEKSEEDTVSSSLCQSHVIQGECYQDSLTVHRPDWFGSSKRVEMHLRQDSKHELAGSDYPVLDESRAKHINSQVTETHSCQHDPIAEVADCACVNEKSGVNELQREERKTDRLVNRAAVSLLHISLESSNCCQYCIPDAGSERLTKELKEKPQCSSDSFESMVLRLKDSSIDDYCVTSAPVDVKETEKEMKGSGVSLRRGRRLKDFQKDVLPGLVSLSRHEICEDIHSIGGIVRTNDFRKSRSKKASAQNWFEPMRSRRSRFNYVC